MADLTTKYMGIELKNPVIVGACNLVEKPENLKKIIFDLTIRKTRN